MDGPYARAHSQPGPRGDCVSLMLRLRENTVIPTFLHGTNPYDRTCGFPETLQGAQVAFKMAQVGPQIFKKRATVLLFCVLASKLCTCPKTS